ncbi:MAG: HAMP domain-containing histidine kinase [Archangium sp.]|nr:HAMP domain-containing histidine kinase [Archangium sp.]
MNSERVALQDLEEAALDRLFDQGLRLRLYLGPVLFLSTIALIAWDAAPWRRWLLLSMVAVATARLSFEFIRSFKEKPTRGRLASILPFPATALILVVSSSGGADSPIAVMLPLVTVFISMFLRPRIGVLFAIIFTVGLWAVTFIEHWELVGDFIPGLLGGGSRLSNGPMLFSRVFLLSAAVSWGALMGWVMRNAFRSATQKALDARDDVLKQHDESTRTLTTLAGEIAHELKNPLASVKGLAQLLDRDMEGKDKERLTVLRREVDRMQEILESFLTFSRPLVPLAVGEVKLNELADQVLALHEGMAHERQVSFRVDAREFTVKADARKLQQVMINLVQNALDASVVGGAIDVVVRAEPNGGGSVLVMDRGAGIADPERAFVAGVRNKPRGSGLGLTVSRQLARQHGGDVTLAPRDGGGTIAQLSLPGAPT